MKNLQTSEPTTKKFLAAIGPALRAYRSVALSFVALVHEGQEIILSASVRLARDLTPTPARKIRTPSFRAAQLLLPGTGEITPQLIDAMTSNQGFVIEDHLLKLLASSRGDYSAYRDQPSRSANEDTKLIERLKIRGESKWTLCSRVNLDADAELREQGFDSLHDLLWEFGLGESDDSYFEILADPLRLFSSDSQVAGQNMRIVAQLPLELSNEHFRVSVRSANRSDRGTQRLVLAERFDWTKAGEYQIAAHEEEVNLGSVLDCQAIYAGTVYDTVRLFDPTASANARRAIIETNDPGLKHFCNAFQKISGGDNRWRNEFEALVTIILYMLGFETVRVGGMRKPTDGPDIYASTPSGDLLVVECTTSSFNEEKLSKLLARAKKAEDTFHGTTLGPRSISALMATTQSLEDLDSLVEVADRKHVILLCGAQLKEAIDRTRFTQNPDEVLAKWRNAAAIRSLSSPFRD